MLVRDGRRTLKTGDDLGKGCKNDEGTGSVLYDERFKAQSA